MLFTSRAVSLVLLLWLTGCNRDRIEAENDGVAKRDAASQQGPRREVSKCENATRESPCEASPCEASPCEASPCEASQSKTSECDAPTQDAPRPEVEDAGQTVVPTGADAGSADDAPPVQPASSSVSRPDDGSSSPPTETIPEPVLRNLTVKQTRVPTQPAFDPDVLRYGAIVADAGEALAVTLSLDPGLDAKIAGIDAEDGEPVNVDPGESERIDIVVENGLGATRTYEIMVLPEDFPDLVVTKRDSSASEDPIYVAMRGSELFFLAKLDASGVPLFQRAVGHRIYDFKRHPNGEISYAEEKSSSEGSEHVLLDENFEELRRVTTVGLLNTDEHEFHVLPNGNFVLLAYEPSQRDMTAYGGSENQRVDDAILQEITPEGEVVFEWNSWDHIAYEESRYGERDYAHINSVFVEADGNWLVSSRGLSQVLKIDRATGDVLWRFGGVSNQFEIVGDPLGNLCGQHTASRTPDGHLLLFDNGQHCWPENPDRAETTRVVEFELDEAALAARLVWSYQDDDAYTYSQGSAQRLSNGHTFIGWGLGPRAMATEVDPDGKVVFEIEASGGRFVSYRSWRFPD